MNTSTYLLDQLLESSQRLNGLAIYGGTFDPVHAGHLNVLKKLLVIFPQVLLAPTASNPLKLHPPTPLVHRLAMLRLALATYFPQQEVRPHSESSLPAGLLMYERGYRYAREVVDAVRAAHPDQSDLWWAVGEDIAAEVAQWKDWSQLDVKTIVAPIEVDVHASVIRAGRAQALPCVRDYIQRHRLYE